MKIIYNKFCFYKILKTLTDTHIKLSKARQNIKEMILQSVFNLVNTGIVQKIS